MYSPDRGFVKKLKALDQRLSVRWDVHRERWTIYEKIKQKLYCGEFDGVPLYTIKDVDMCALLVQNEDGSYRPLDDRTMCWLRYNDKQRSADILREKIEKFNKQEAQIEKRAEDKINDVAAEMADVSSFYRFGDPSESTPLKEYV